MRRINGRELLRTTRPYLLNMLMPIIDDILAFIGDIMQLAGYAQ